MTRSLLLRGVVVVVVAVDVVYTGWRGRRSEILFRDRSPHPACLRNTYFIFVITRRPRIAGFEWRKGGGGDRVVAEQRRGEEWWDCGWVVCTDGVLVIPFLTSIETKGDM